MSVVYQGRSAYWHDPENYSNPYEEGTEQYQEFEWGWMEAEEHNQR